MKFLIQVFHSLSSLNGKLEMLAFVEGGKPEIPRGKNPGARSRTDNNLNNRYLNNTELQSREASKGSTLQIS